MDWWFQSHGKSFFVVDPMVFCPIFVPRVFHQKSWVGWGSNPPTYRSEKWDADGIPDAPPSRRDHGWRAVVNDLRENVEMWVKKEEPSTVGFKNHQQIRSVGLKHIETINSWFTAFPVLEVLQESHFDTGRSWQEIQEQEKKALRWPEIQ